MARYEDCFVSDSFAFGVEEEMKEGPQPTSEPTAPEGRYVGDCESKVYFGEADTDIGGFIIDGCADGSVTKINDWATTPLVGPLDLTTTFCDIL